MQICRNMYEDTHMYKFSARPGAQEAASMRSSTPMKFMWDVMPMHHDAIDAYVQMLASLSQRGVVKGA